MYMYGVYIYIYFQMGINEYNNNVYTYGSMHINTPLKQKFTYLCRYTHILQHSLAVFLCVFITVCLLQHFG